MSRPILYLAITNHGFGHAVRAATVAAEVQRLDPDVLLILATMAPRWLLESYIEGDFIHRPCRLDVGVVQTDSFTMDKETTLAKLQQIESRQSRLVANEVSYLDQNRVGLVLADIPPLAAVIAREVGVPGWMMGNFGWDFIYEPWGEAFAPTVDWIRGCFRQCDRLFRLPLHESMGGFPLQQDVGLTGGTPRYSRAEIQENWGLHTPSERTILLTFGGLGLEQIPYHTVEHFPDWQFITFDSQAPSLPNLIRVTSGQYRPVDFMPFCGRVVSKPGYSTYAEALRLGIPIATLPRQDFAEAPILLQGLQDYGHHQILQSDLFFGGQWSFLEERPQPPRQPTLLDFQGHQTIAQAVLEHLHS